MIADRDDVAEQGAFKGAIQTGDGSSDFIFRCSYSFLLGMPFQVILCLCLMSKSVQSDGEYYFTFFFLSVFYSTSGFTFISTCVTFVALNKDLK